ncbi:MAG: hypothetical protein R2856_20865 [Caldilineaceae bacterium]
MNGIEDVNLTCRLRSKHTAVLPLLTGPSLLLQRIRQMAAQKSAA